MNAPGRLRMQATPEEARVRNLTRSCTSASWARGKLIACLCTLSTVTCLLATGGMLVDEVLDRVRREQREAWSPRPILGFRLWVEDDGLHGAKVRWRGPTMTGGCLNKVHGEDIPHSIRRCGPAPVYDMKPAEIAAEETALR